MTKTIKRSLALLLSILMLVSVVPVAFADEIQSEGNFVYEVVDDEAVVIGYTGTATEIVIPEKLGGYPVVKVGIDPATSRPVFHSNAAITSVVLPDTVEEVIPGSFYCCSNLEIIDLGSGVKTIGNTVFMGCSKLTTVTIGAEVTTIEGNAFATDTIKTVNYEGTIAQWNDMLSGVATGNDYLLNANIVFCYGKNCDHSATEIDTYTVAPTCTTAGSADITCVDCGVDATVTIAPLGHDIAEDAWNIEAYANCVQAGLKSAVCGREGCGVVKEETPALGHVEVVGKGKDATCTEDGYTASITCNSCNEQIQRSTDIDALGHNFIKDETQSYDATCTDAGLYIGACERCGEEKNEAINPLLHIIETVEASPATCTTSGYEAYEYCTREGCTYNTKKPINAFGHESAYEATCTEDEICNICGEVLNEALGHTEEILERVEPTCTETGLTAGKKCSTCDLVLIPQEEIASNGHSNEVVLGQEAKCEEDGLTSGIKCTVCGVWSLPQEPITKTGHKEVEIEAIAPTCTKGGYTAGVKCEYCGEIFDEPQPIKKYGHNYITVPGKAATCTEEGLTDGKKCSRCDNVKVKQEVILMLEHTTEIIPGKAATCTEAGYTESEKCTVCGTFTVEAEVIEAGGHEEGPAATCTAPQICTVCEEVLADVIEHTPGEEATCTAPQICTVCETVLVEALGHDWEYDEAVTKPATCHSEGYEKAECKRCNYGYEQKVPATGHNIQNWTTIIDPTCKTEGKAIGLCLNCKYNIEKSVAVVDHKDDNADNKCDFCSLYIGPEEEKPEDDNKEDSGECTCNCHAVGFKGLIFDFFLIFLRIFGLNKTCKCGVAHY